jgi:hypothetical protein
MGAQNGREDLALRWLAMTHARALITGVGGVRNLYQE